METRRRFKQISRLTTTDLLVAKMNCTKRNARYKALKLALVALTGIFVTQIAKMLFDASKVMDYLDYLSIPLTFYCVFGYLFLNSLEASITAQKELICDLLALRMNRTGRKS